MRHDANSLVLPGGISPFSRGPLGTHKIFAEAVTDRLTQAQNLFRGPWAHRKIRTAKFLCLSLTNRTKNNVKTHGPTGNSHSECTVFVTDKFDS